MEKAILSKFDRLMMAVAFAEEAEFGTAREVITEGECKNKRTPKRTEMRKQQPLWESY